VSRFARTACAPAALSAALMLREPLRLTYRGRIATTHAGSSARLPFRRQPVLL
jgi:hypothetical protein